MKSFLLSMTVVAAIFTTPALAADVGVSISLGHPNFYGHIDIGDFPAPPLILPQPIIIERGAPMDRPLVYLRVPDKHRKNWKRYCRKYKACGEPVVFVRDDWYRREYVPRYQERHRGHRNDRRDDRRDDRRERREERRDRWHDRR